MRWAVPVMLVVALCAAPVIAQDTFTATFSPEPGNAWWIETDVSGDAPIVAVDARVDGGAWQSLEKRSWGSWAASIHAPDGSTVQFRAIDDRGRIDESGGYRWPEATPVDGGSTGGSDDPATGFDAAFRTPGGNEWWVEVYVDGNEPLAGVEGRDDGGAWVALEKKSWGAWARSFHVEDGSLVDFRATGAGGGSDVSGQYRWPSGEQVTSEPDGSDDDTGDDGSGGNGTGDDGTGSEPSITDVAFGPKASNEWWVETLAVGDGEPIDSVDARAGDGTWHALTYRDWGAWAASFHVPPGDTVTFRATTPNGTDTSHAFHWPAADAVGGDGTWPEEGSFMQQDGYHSSSAGPISNEWRADEVYHDGLWWSHSTGTHEDPGGTSPIERWEHFEAQPRQRTDVGPGDTYDGIEVHGADTYAMHHEGDVVQVDVWRGTWHEPGCDGSPDTEPCDYADIEWDQATGLELDRHNGICCRTGHGFEVTDTDAPLAIRP